MIVLFSDAAATTASGLCLLSAYFVMGMYYFDYLWLVVN